MTAIDSSRIRVSFEFFPPKTDKMEQSLWTAVERLAPLRPSFVSVTYGAGGSTRERTHATVERMVRETSLKPAAHLTCVGATRDQVDEVAREYWQAGIRHIVALRGDPAEGVGARYVPHPGGYASTPELIAGLKRIGDFEITVSAYPERHPESPDVAHDVALLKRKVEAGATRAITQFFFDNDVYDRFVDRARAAGIDIPILPGILPVTNFELTSRFAARAGANVPARMRDRFAGLDDDHETRQLVAATVACEQVFDLMRRGYSDFHFYTMNRADLVYAICHQIGVRVPASASPATAA